MKFEFKDPTLGDMIRVKKGQIYHYGIYVSDEEVIQFGLAPTQRSVLDDSQIEVLSSDIDTFLSGDFLEVAVYDKKEQKKNRKPKEIVAYARTRLGTKGYNIIYNNCEHFVNECVSGTRYSSQSDGLREMLRSMPVLDVYFAAMPQNATIGKVYPKERYEEIMKVSNDRYRAEKYYVWRLLEYALRRSLGLNIEKLEITKDSNGKWHTPACEFSLSHSGGALAVTISRKAVGIDIESFDAIKSERIAKHILTDNESNEFFALEQDKKAIYLLKKWTEKEAYFKACNSDVFRPSEYDSSSLSVIGESICIDGKDYYYSVFSDTPQKLRKFVVDDIERI